MQAAQSPRRHQSPQALTVFHPQTFPAFCAFFSFTLSVYTPFSMTTVSFTASPFADISKYDRTGGQVHIIGSIKGNPLPLPRGLVSTHAYVTLVSCCIQDCSDQAKSQAVRCVLCVPLRIHLAGSWETKGQGRPSPCQQQVLYLPK